MGAAVGDYDNDGCADLYVTALGRNQLFRNDCDGAFTETSLFADALAGADAVLEPGAPFHIHFSDIAYANRNETKHLPYGEGTLRAEPLGEALAAFERPATVISEAPDLESSLAIRAALEAGRVTRS